jgi:hypothetical protein
MLKIVLLLLWINSSGEVVLEQHPTASIEECMAKGQARIDAQMLEPSFDRGLFADCVELPVVEAKVTE